MLKGILSSTKLESLLEALRWSQDEISAKPMPKFLTPLPLASSHRSSLLSSSNHDKLMLLELTLKLRSRNQSTSFHPLDSMLHQATSSCSRKRSMGHLKPVANSGSIEIANFVSSVIAN